MKIKGLRTSGPIFECKALFPGRYEVILNHDHPFIQHFYLSKATNPVMRNALDLFFYAYTHLYAKKINNSQALQSFEDDIHDLSRACRNALINLNEYSNDNLPLPEEDE